MAIKADEKHILEQLGKINSQLTTVVVTRTQCESNEKGSAVFLRKLKVQQKDLEDARDQLTDKLERLGAIKDY